MADQEIAELKELVRQNIALSQETNKQIHKMQRASRLKSFFWLLVFCASIGSSAYAYFYIIEPKLSQIRTVYTQNVGQAQSLWGWAGDMFKNMPGATTTQ